MSGKKTGLHFDFEWRITVFTAVMVPLMLSLGFWQLQRADEKASLKIRHAHQVFFKKRVGIMLC